jgi:hypothetical protein
MAKPRSDRCANAAEALHAVTLSAGEGFFAHVGWCGAVSAGPAIAPSVAVLPFRNLSIDPANGRLADKFLPWTSAAASQRGGSSREMVPELDASSEIRVVYTSRNVVSPRRDVAGSVFLETRYTAEAIYRACCGSE